MQVTALLQGFLVFRYAFVTVSNVVRSIKRCRRVRALFAVHSSINVRFAMSGAGTAAYRFSRLVNVPEYNMSKGFMRIQSRAGVVFGSLAIGMLTYPVSGFAGAIAETIAVNVDQAKLVRSPERISTIVVGNPLIADVSLQPGGIIVVTGKGYGATNVIALDRTGEVLMDRIIQVGGPTDRVITMYKGANRESYSCMPLCERRVTLGDGEAYFKSTMDQAGSLNSQATGAAVER